jgi:hypothetical protein
LWSYFLPSNKCLWWLWSIFLPSDKCLWWLWSYFLPSDKYLCLLWSYFLPSNKCLCLLWSYCWTKKQNHDTGRDIESMVLSRGLNLSCIHNKKDDHRRIDIQVLNFEETRRKLVPILPTKSDLANNLGGNIRYRRKNMVSSQSHWFSIENDLNISLFHR